MNKIAPLAQCWLAALPLAAVALLAGCGSPSTQQQAQAPQGFSLLVSNPDSAARPQAGLVLSTNQLLELGVSLPSGQLPLPTVAGQPVPCQWDDTDQDGNWDEMALLLNLKGKQTVQIDFAPADSAPSFPQQARASLRLSRQRNNQFETMKDELRPADWQPMSLPLYYLMEGPAWENDKVAFRHYFDSRNGKDIFGKTTSRLLVDSIGVPDSPYGNYHSLKDWGMDVLKVGNSLGAGAIALKRGDSLHTVKMTSEARYRLVNDGPVRGIFRIDYIGWEVDGSSLNASELISIWPGTYWYANTVQVQGAQPGDELVAGITSVKLEGEASQGSTAGMATLHTHGPQSENKDMLGMALLVPQAQYRGYVQAPRAGASVVATHGARIALGAQPATYYFMAGWEKSDPAFGTAQGFGQAVQAAAQQLGQPLRVRLAE